MFEEFEKQEEIQVIKAIEKIKECCNYYQNHYKSCVRCMLYNGREDRCFLVENFKSPKMWQPIIKIQL